MSPSEHGRDCSQSIQAASWTLGALPGDEAERYAEHLQTCESCRAEVALLAPVVDLLAVAVSPVSAPEALRGRLMEVVESEAQLLRAAGAGADRPPVRASRRRLRALGVLGVAAAMAAGVIVGVFAINQNGSGSARRITGVVTAAGAHAVLRESAGGAELDVANLPSPPPGRIYQVWLQLPGRAPRATAALFDVGASRSATVPVPGSLRGVQRVMVTAEPLGGSRTGVPSEAPIITVTL